VTACALPGAIDPPCAQAQSRQACLDQHYFGQASPAPELPSCSQGPAPAPLALTLRVGLYHADTISDAEVAELTRALQHAVAQVGIRFSARDASKPSGLRYGLTGSERSIDAALAREGIMPNVALDSAEAGRAHRAVADVMFAELRAFVERTGRDAEQPDLNLIVLEQLIEPQLAEILLGSAGSSIPGFGLSPRMLARVPPDDPGFELQSLAGLPSDFTPLALLGARDLAEYADAAENITAHELGHTLGLIHSPDPDNLMYTAPKIRCRPYLDERQLALIAGPGDL
jgi:hypothetical protein